jgi:peptidyl-prolyl cis-trans isomerase B (cyclophilin B)
MSKQWDTPPEMQIDADANYSVTMETSKGTIEIELFAEAAPVTVNNFIFLIREGYYDGVSFHRVIPDFMVQGGDPTGSGSGGPGYRFEDEFEGNPHKHERGTLSMANSGPATNGSQFFICHSPQSHLDGRHTVFGIAREGLDVVDLIEANDTMVKVTVTE